MDNPGASAFPHLQTGHGNLAVWVQGLNESMEVDLLGR